MTPHAAPPLADFSDPFEWFAAWLTEAEASEPNDPNAMCLATADLAGRPAARMVLLKGLDGAEHPQRGFVFYTNTTSRKGTEIAANVSVGLLFHWKSLRRQVRIEGSAGLVDAAEADAYYASRPRLSRLGAWASDQSRPLDSRATLERRLAAMEETYPGETIPRPPHWTGYRVVPRVFEFWQDRPFRLHDRSLFEREQDGGGWRRTMLYP